MKNSKNGVITIAKGLKTATLIFLSLIIGFTMTACDDDCTHDWSWSVTNAADACERGIETRTCDLCPDIEIRLTSGHDYDASGFCTIAGCYMIQMMPITGGTFTMGSENADDWNARPPHQVTLSNFSMSKYQVTQELWVAVMGKNPSWFSSNPEPGDEQGKRPVDQVTWFDAIEFCNKLSILEGLTPVYTITDIASPPGYPIRSATVTENWSNNGYRLPTEAQWEYASRAGISDYVPYTPAWNGTDVAAAPGWYSGNSNNRTRQVGLKPANDFGLHDMHGNLWEWCWDGYGYYTSGAKENPTGPEFSDHRVIRGGCWDDGVRAMRSAARTGYGPGGEDIGNGFRVVLP